MTRAALNWALPFYKAALPFYKAVNGGKPFMTRQVPMQVFEAMARRCYAFVLEGGKLLDWALERPRV